jgi:hypothetical protein
MLESMEKEVKSLKRELFTLCWYMRGGLTYEEASFLSPQERGIIRDLIDSNLETTKKSGLPFF